MQDTRQSQTQMLILCQDKVCIGILIFFTDHCKNVGLIFQSYTCEYQYHNGISKLRNRTNIYRHLGGAERYTKRGTVN